jgi:hypothetical protein
MTLCASRPICQAFKLNDNQGLSIVSAFDPRDSKPHYGISVPLSGFELGGFSDACLAKVLM